MLTSLLIAVMAMCALAAPFPATLPQKRSSFSVSVKPRVEARLAPKDAIVKAYGKYGWTSKLSNLAKRHHHKDDNSTGDDQPWWLPDLTTSTVIIPAATSAPAIASSAAVTSAAAGATSSASANTAGDANKHSSTTAGTATTTGSATSSADTGSVEASPEADDSEYLEAVTIGGQKLTLDFDTGSSDL